MEYYFQGVYLLISLKWTNSQNSCCRRQANSQCTQKMWNSGRQSRIVLSCVAHKSGFNSEWIPIVWETDLLKQPWENDERPGGRLVYRYVSDAFWAQR